MFWELIPNGFLCKESNFSFYYIQYVFPFVPLKMWAVKIQKKKNNNKKQKKTKNKKKKQKKKKQKTNKQTKKKQSVLKNENTNYFDHIHIVPYMAVNRNVYPLYPTFI